MLTTNRGLFKTTDMPITQANVKDILYQQEGFVHHNLVALWAIGNSIYMYVRTNSQVP